MLFKMILWAAIGYIVYSWIQEKMALKGGGKQTTIHDHHSKSKKKKKKVNDDDYIDFEEIK